VPTRPKRATIRQLADKTGLSPSAVSYALRGIQVSAATQERVQQAAAEMGYEADPIARALRGGSTGMVALLVGSLSDFFTQELSRAIQRELRVADRHTLVADADGTPGMELELARRLVDQRVDGIIVSPIGPPSGDWADIAERVPVVTIGDALPGVPTAGEVVFDNDRGVEDTLRHLSDLGHERVAVLSWAAGTSPGRRAERAVERASRSLGIDCEIVPCAYSLNGSKPLAAELLSGSDRPTAVFCLSDSIAYGVYVACAELGLRIPDDVSVVGFDDHPISRLLQPALTTTDWGAESVARSATGFLIAALDDNVTDRRRLVEPTLRPRASTGPPSRVA
jgi:LacI family transcriptional regulator